MLPPVRIRFFLPTFDPSHARRRGRFWQGKLHRQAWPMATAFGGKGLTMLTSPAVFATKRSTASYGQRKSYATKKRAARKVRILTGIHTAGQDGSIRADSGISAPPDPPSLGGTPRHAIARPIAIAAIRHPTRR